MEQLTLENFEEKTAGKNIVIDFFADWCGPCKMMNPVLDALSIELAGQVEFFKVNSDEQPELVEQFSVQSLPFFVAKSASGVKKTKVGAMQKVRMLEFIKEAI